MNMIPASRVVASVALAITSLVASLAHAASDDPGRDLASSLRVYSSQSSSLASFITAADGGPIAVAGADEPRADAMLAQYGHLFGVSDPAAQLAVTHSGTDAIGFVHTTYRQFHKGVPVFSGMLIVHQDPWGQFTAANGDFHPISTKLSTSPTLGAAEASEIARTAIGSANSVVAQQELVIVDPGWYGDPAIGEHLAYHVILSDVSGHLVEAFFVDAHSGAILDRWSMTCAALDRAIHDADLMPVFPGPLSRAEGDPPTGIADVDAAYDYAGDTYAYYWNGFGRDGVDDNGLIATASVNSTAIPCPNASWSFLTSIMVFCNDTISDDIVAHELAHGVTQFSANLIYQNQSGQLNESYSDVFGELVDLFNGGAAFAGVPEAPPAWAVHPTGPGTDTPNNLRTGCSAAPSHLDGLRWLITEDGPGWGGPIRDMWNPDSLGDPDQTTSALQSCLLIDAGGVHSGSGIVNHAFAILCDGKSFNGFNVNGIGPIKAGAVWYRALTVYLTPASDFLDAYAAFNQSAADLVGTFPLDPRTGLASGSAFTSGDATEVDLALRAVELDIPGSCGETANVLNPAAPAQCAGRVAIFADDFEGGVNGWTLFNSAPPTAYDWQQTVASLPAARAGTAWFCNDPNLGDCSTSGIQEFATHSLVSPPIVMPAGLQLPTLSFAHLVETELRWDGCHVLLRINGGAWIPVPAAAFIYNSYNTTLFTASQNNTNPNSGQLTFSGADGQWGTSLVDLSTYVGPVDTLEVRFDLSKDQCFGITGWFVDDFEVYHCPASTDCNNNGVADELDVAQGIHRDIFVSQPPNHSTGNPSDLDNGGLGVTAMADDFIFLKTRTIETIKIYGGYFPDSLAPTDHFTVIVHEDEAGFPGAVLATQSDLASTRVNTGETFLSVDADEWQFTITLDSPIILPAGTYHLELLNDTTGSPDTFIWERALVGHILGGKGAFEAPGSTWFTDTLINMSMEILGPEVGQDCNSNTVLDQCDPWGDNTGDGLVGLDDLAELSTCLSGPNTTAAGGCACQLDIDGDGDLDLLDYAAFQPALD